MKTPLWLKAYNSPFKTPTLKWYFGKTRLGVPYMLPRKWVKFTYEDALESATKEVNNERMANYGKNPLDIVDKYKNYSKAVPLKFGFSSCGLGWKTKFDSYRFEYSPVLSFVFFGYQIAITVVAPHCYHYWESFLAWHYETDKTKSWGERLEYCIKGFPNTWTSHEGDKKIKTDYWTLILKDKWKNV